MELLRPVGAEVHARKLFFKLSKACLGNWKHLVLKAYQHYPVYQNTTAYQIYHS